LARVATIRIIPGGAPDPTADQGPAEPVVPWAFPIVAAHRFGSGAGRFGGGRRHEAQDMPAACGTRLEAAMTGRGSKANPL